MKPSERYQRDVADGRINSDPVQLAALRKLDDLHERLIVRSNRPAPTWLQRIVGRKPLGPERGLYIWGGVGRGKTYLMDLFFECLPGERKLRMHFHRFMQRVHRELRLLAGREAPLQGVADAFAAEADVLCFDEFFVSDIGDAMILGELLQGLFARGVALVATSNIAPPGLYANGLQRRRFLPAIDLLIQHTEVYELDGGADYRLRALQQAALFHAPLGPAAEAALAQCFARLARDTAHEHVELEIEGRTIRALRCTDDVVWFDFREICDGPRSQNDYIELARIYHAVVISGVPRFTINSENQARRFISLVDEFYDHSVKLIVSAETPILELYAGSLLKFEFQRTVSRLLEMQSEDYLKRSHHAG